MGKFLQALGLETLSESPLGDYSADVTPPSRSTVSPVTVDRALSLPAVYRAIQITAGMAAQLSIKAWRGEVDVTADQPLVTAPDPWRPLSSWVERAVVCLAVDGNAFLYKHRAANSTVVALEVLHPGRVTVHHDQRTGVKSYTYAGAGGKTRKLVADDVEHVWGLEVPGYDRGLSPIQMCRVALGGVIDVRDYAGNWFRSSDVPTGILKTDQKIDAETAARYKDRWINPDVDSDGNPTNKYLGPTVRVLGQGLSYDPIVLKPEDAQWLEAQRFGVLDVARMFGLPAEYLHAAVEGSSLTYSNLEMVDAQFLRTTLFPVYLRKLEAALTNVLPRGQRARFDTTPLLRPDAKTRAEIDALYLTNGVYDAGHVRTREGIPGPAPAQPAPAAQEAPA